MNSQIAQALLKQTVDQYNRIAPHFDETRNSSTDCTPLRQFVNRNDLVLDAACGNGRLTDALRGTGINLIGCDGSAELIAAAQKKYAADVAAGWVGFTRADLTALPFDTSQFNLIFCLAALHHLPSVAIRVEVLRDLHNCLRRGGLLIGTVWNLRGEPWIDRYDLAHQLQNPRRGWDVGDVEIPWKRGGETVLRYYHAFTAEELAGLLSAAHVTVRLIHYVSRELLEVSPTDAYNIIWIAEKK